VTKFDATGSSLIYSTFLGGTLGLLGGEEWAVDVAVDATGIAYVAGSTFSIDFPTTVGAYDNSLNGFSDMFVTKLDAAGGTSLYSTFLGGGSGEQAAGIAVDQAGQVYVTGITDSRDFPTTASAYDTTFTGSSRNNFVTKLHASGAALVYSTFFGESSEMSTVAAIAVDSQGNAYVAGETQDTDFPTTPGAYDATHNGQSDVFLAKLNASGTSLVYSTFLGGRDSEGGLGLSVDATGKAYVTGVTQSADFPTTVGALDRSSNGSAEAFVTKVDANGASLVYSTFLGGARDEIGQAIAVDALGHAYVTGWTQSSNFPTTGGAYDVGFNGVSDVFVTKLDATGTMLGYSTFLGGRDEDSASGIAVDALGHAYVTGSTRSSNFPTTADAFGTTWNYSDEAFVTKLDATGAALSYSILIGGTGSDFGVAIALDLGGNAYVAGLTTSANFPTTPGAFDDATNRIGLPIAGVNEAFVIKLGEAGPSLPRVNITANGTDGPLTLTADDPLTIVATFDAGDLDPNSAGEVFIGVQTPEGRVWLDAAAQRFVPGLRAAYAGPLSSAGPVTLVDLPNASLPPGLYWWFVWVDYDVNGVPSGGTFDVVLTVVQRRR
jgi:hypothetical protein